MTNTNMHLEGLYHQARNNIIKPQSYVPGNTRYFWEKWAPDLGPNLTMIIMQLRRRSFYDPRTGETRNHNTISLTTLEKDTGLSGRTIQRELKREISLNFVRRTANYNYSNKLHKKVRTANTYQVFLDEPLHPSDIKKLPMKNLETEDILTDLNDKLSLRSKKSVDNSSPKRQIVAHIYERQIVATNVNTSLNTLNVNVHEKSKINFENFSFTHPLLDKILTATKDKKSIPYFKKIISECSEATINNALEDLQTYQSSGRKVKNPGAFFTSRIKTLKNSKYN